MKKILPRQAVLAKYGFNNITMKPFQFLYEFGYYNINGDCICYLKGERNMQDSCCFKRGNIRIATEEEIKENYWGR